MTPNAVGISDFPVRPEVVSKPVLSFVEGGEGVAHKTPFMLQYLSTNGLIQQY